MWQIMVNEIASLAILTKLGWPFRMILCPSAFARHHSDRSTKHLTQDIVPWATAPGREKWAVQDTLRYKASSKILIKWMVTWEKHLWMGWFPVATLDCLRNPEDNWGEFDFSIHIANGWWFGVAFGISENTNKVVGPWDQSHKTFEIVSFSHLL